MQLFYLAIVGSDKPNKEAHIRSLLGEYEQQVEWYTGGDVPAARNAALEDACERGLPCVQVHTDLLGFLYNKEQSTVGMPFPAALRLLFDATMGHPRARLGGCSGIQNRVYLDRLPRESTNLVLGETILVIRPTLLRFDVALLQAHVAEYCLQHAAEYGGVLRSNRLVARHASVVFGQDAGQTSFEYHALHARWPGRLVVREDFAIKLHPFPTSVLV